MNIDQLLSNTTTGDVKAPPRMPEGHYRFIITGYQLLPFHWQKSNISGQAYVPTIKPIASLEADDEENPELAEEQRAALAEYGDWTSKEFTFSINNNDFNPPKLMARVADVNFPLIETDPDGSNPRLYEAQAWRFYLREEKGGEIQEQGFAHDVLGLSYPEPTPFGQVLDDTVNKTFVAQIAYEVSRNDPSRSYMVVQNPTADLEA